MTTPRHSYTLTGIVRIDGRKQEGVGGTFVVDLGTGVDVHGGDATSAALKAVPDCFNHVSLPGLYEVAGLRDPNLMEIEVLLVRRKGWLR